MKSKKRYSKDGLNNLHLRDVGILELLFALYPILSGYDFWGLPGSLFIPVIMIIMAFIFKKHFRIAANKPILFFLGFFIIHEILWIFVMKTVPSYYFNSIISSAVMLITILIIGASISYKKMVGSINWVALLSSGGMVYHFVIALTGGTFHPLLLPFMPEQGAESRAYEELTRPTSFFWEPASYVAFMMIPLFLAMREKKYIWTTIIVLSIFMSSSTTGLIISFFMVGFFIVTQKAKLGTRLFFLMLAVFMLVILTQTDLFTQSVEKIDNTEISENVRLTQGPLVVSEMQPSNYILGVPYANAYEFCTNNSVSSDIIYYGEDVYMSTFWIVILRFGIIGLIFYLNIYWYFIKHNRQLLPFVLCLIATLFSSSYYLGATFCFQISFMLAFESISKKRSIKQLINKKRNANLIKE